MTPVVLTASAIMENTALSSSSGYMLCEEIHARVACMGELDRLLLYKWSVQVELLLLHSFGNSSKTGHINYSYGSNKQFLLLRR